MPTKEQWKKFHHGERTKPDYQADNWKLSYRGKTILERGNYGLCAATRNKLVKENPANWKKQAFSIDPIT